MLDHESIRVPKLDGDVAFMIYSYKKLRTNDKMS